ncbi:MAG: protein arginine kinase [Candidatus Omnitrophica bacterium]|nr:protein arginine kinase [Candidatus Omnitrophota bacterium]
MDTFDIKELLKKSGEWLKGTGPSNDIVISSRIRLARNIAGYKFAAFLNKQETKEMVDKIIAATKKSNYLKADKVVLLESLDVLGRQLLLERHLISREHAEAKGIRALSFSEDEIVSIMINEEDHLRIQVLQSGFNLMETWRMIDKVDSELEASLPFAFHQHLGYLTACPTNVGTGLRASCMLHLPSLVMTKQINKVLQAIGKLNLAVRGLYGEGTQASGNFFQFSNQTTLGKNEEKIIDDLEKVIKQIIEHEREARIALQSKKRDKLYDQIWRAVGILKCAHLMTSQETTSLLSMVRLGVDLNIIKDLDRQKLNELFIVTQPAHLQLLAGKTISPKERDIRRAQIIRQYLKTINML